MNSNKFRLTELKRLVNEGQRRDHIDAKEYIQQYFFPLSNGMVLFKRLKRGVKINCLLRILLELRGHNDSGQSYISGS